MTVRIPGAIPDLRFVAQLDMDVPSPRENQDSLASESYLIAAMAGRDEIVLTADDYSLLRIYAAAQ